MHLALGLGLVAWQILMTTMAECPPSCECKWRGGKESVICSPHLGQFNSIPMQLDPGTQVLDLGGNPLKLLEDGVFQAAALLNLQKVLLSGCRIEKIQATAFQGLSNVVELDLSHNQLTAVPSHALDFIPQLRELKLSGNPLQTLPSHAFSSVSQLVRLELSDCQLNRIEPRALYGLELLEWLKLDGNLLEVLPAQALSPLRSLHGLELQHNPWQCSCGLRAVRIWLATRNMPLTSPPVCLTPLRLRGKAWHRLPVEELACLPSLQPVNALVTSQAGNRVSLSCQVTGVPEPQVTWWIGDRLITNLTVETPRNDSPLQMYLIYEKGAMEKVSELTLPAGREKDSGLYVCQAANAAGQIRANITLFVSPVTVSNHFPASVGRGLLAGLLLGAVSVILLGLLICVLCWVRIGAARRPLRVSSAATGKRTLTSNGGTLAAASGYQKVNLDEKKEDNGPRERDHEASDLLIENRHAHWREYAPLPHYSAEEPSGKVWCVHDAMAELEEGVNSDSHSPAQKGRGVSTTRRHSGDSQTMATGSHRPIALNQRLSADSTFFDEFHEFQLAKVAAESSDHTPESLYPSPTSLSSTFPDLLTSSSPRKSDSNLANVLECFDNNQNPFPDYDVRWDDRTLPWNAENDADHLLSHELGRLDVPRAEERSYHATPTEDEHDFFANFEGNPPESELADDEEEFQRSYEYHTTQLDRFLAEYRALQDRLAQMQATCDKLSHHPKTRVSFDEANGAGSNTLARSTSRNSSRAQRLRPILKNRRGSAETSSSAWNSSSSNSRRWGSFDSAEMFLDNAKYAAEGTGYDTESEQSKLPKRRYSYYEDSLLS